MIGSIFKRQEAYAALRKALENPPEPNKKLRELMQKKAPWRKHKDASAKQRAAVPSTKTKLKRTIAKLKKSGKAREL